VLDLLPQVALLVGYFDQEFSHDESFDLGGFTKCNMLSPKPLPQDIELGGTEVIRSSEGYGPSAPSTVSTPGGGMNWKRVSLNSTFSFHSENRNSVVPPSASIRTIRTI
jgi:hypothetical protein